MELLVVVEEVVHEHLTLKVQVVPVIHHQSVHHKGFLVVILLVVLQKCGELVVVDLVLQEQMAVMDLRVMVVTEYKMIFARVLMYIMPVVVGDVMLMV